MKITKDTSLTAALRSFCYTHGPGKDAGARDILKHGRVVSRGHTRTSAMNWLRAMHPDGFET